MISQPNFYNKCKKGLGVFHLHLVQVVKSRVAMVAIWNLGAPHSRRSARSCANPRPQEVPTHPHEVMKLLLGIKEEALGRAVQEALDREPLKAG